MNYFSLQKLPARFNPIVMPFLLSLLMTCVVSMISTLKSLGFGDFTLSIWMQAWILSWLIAFPVLLLALPIVKKLTFILVEPPY